MTYPHMLEAVFRTPSAYPYPFGSDPLGWLYEATDAELRQLTLPRLRDQAVSVEVVFSEWRGCYLALHREIQEEGLTPYRAKALSQAAHVLRRIVPHRQRCRALLDAAPQPPLSGQN